MITLVNGNIQNASSLAVPNGSMALQLNIDATVIASPFGFVAARVPIVFQFDDTGNILPPAGQTDAMIYSNAELNPQNSIGLGTYYLVTFYDADGARLNQSPMWWQFTEPAGSTVDIGEVIPYATVGGNVIFYPTSFALQPPGLTTLGGIFANPGAPSHWVSAINTDGSVTLTQPDFTDISGTLSNAQLPNPLTFSTITASGLITAQAGIEIGVIGTTSGQITLDGGTSGQSSITAPNIAGTLSNPIAFSNGINIPAGAAYSINSDTGISRQSAGIISVGNGTPGDISGTIQASVVQLGAVGAGPTWRFGAGAPSGSAVNGSLYTNTAGTHAGPSLLYVYDATTTTWVAIA
jgi:hypothetical protein